MRSRPLPSRQPISTRPCGVYLIAFETRFCSSRRNSRRSERTERVLGTKASVSPLSRASGANSTSSWRISSSMRKLDISGRIAPESRREISSSAPRISSTASSEASTFETSRASSPLPLPLHQAGHVEPRRIERLQDVVARGRQKPRLRDVGFLGFAFGARERDVEPRQLLGALLDAAFEVFVGAFQRFGRLDARRHVGRGGDEAAVRHVVGADFDHEAALGEALADRLAAGEVALDAVVHEVFDAPGPERALFAVVAQDFVEPDADARECQRQVENFAELPIPADELQVLVEHRDALAHVIERGLQDFAVVLDRRVGVVEQLERGLGGHRALAQQKRKHEARGRRADRRGKDVLGIAQQVEVRLVLGIEADAAALREAFER